MQRGLIAISYRSEMEEKYINVIASVEHNILQEQTYLTQKAVARFLSWSPLRVPMTETYIPFLIEQAQEKGGKLMKLVHAWQAQMRL
jgi:ABC-type uncharacterized transport system substrate-binding protein